MYGILEFSFVDGPDEHLACLRGTAELARVAEALGYSRLWFGEHHAAGVAHAAPEVLVGAAAATTSRISVGAAGVLLRYRVPAQSAAQFRALAALYQGRIDVGLARGRALQPDLDAALLDGRVPEASYPQRVKAAASLLRGSGFTEIAPRRIRPPHVWLLCVSTESVLLAARLGLSVAVAVFADQPLPPTDIFAAYRDALAPDSCLSSAERPRAVLAAAVECTVGARRSTSATDAPLMRVSAIGEPERCADALQALGARYRADEVVHLDLNARIVDRLRAHERIARFLPMAPAVRAAS